MPRRTLNTKEQEASLTETTQALSKRLSTLLAQTHDAESRGGDLTEPLKARAQRIEQGIAMLESIAADAGELEVLLAMVNARPDDANEGATHRAMDRDA